MDCEAGAARIVEAPDLVYTVVWVAPSGVEGAVDVRGCAWSTAAAHPQEQPKTETKSTGQNK